MYSLILKMVNLLSLSQSTYKVCILSIQKLCFTLILRNIGISYRDTINFRESYIIQKSSRIDRKDNH